MRRQTQQLRRAVGDHHAHVGGAEHIEIVLGVAERDERRVVVASAPRPGDLSGFRRCASSTDLSEARHVNMRGDPKLHRVG